MIDSVEMIRFFTEFILREARGFRMTNALIPLLRHSLTVGRKDSLVPHFGFSCFDIKAVIDPFLLF